MSVRQSATSRHLPLFTLTYIIGATLAAADAGEDARHRAMEAPAVATPTALRAVRIMPFLMKIPLDKAGGPGRGISGWTLS